MLADYIACVVALAAQLEVIEPSPSAPLRLLARALAVAADELTRHGEFIPFGLAVCSTGELVSVAALSCEEEPDVEQLVLLLDSGLEAGRNTGRYLATALALEVEIPDATTRTYIRVLEIRLCHAPSASTLFFPLAVERDQITLDWPHWSEPLASAQGERWRWQGA